MRRGATSAPQDDGFVAAEWAVGIAVLVLPVLLLVAALPAWTARHEAAAAAAREAARATVQAGDGADAVGAGTAAAMALLAGRGVDAAEVDVVLPARAFGGGLPRDGIVEVTVTIPGEPLELPGFGTVDTPAISGSHTRTLDPYRSR